MRSFRLVPLALASAACAAVSPPEPAGPPAFEGVKTIALVRLRGDGDGTRPKDPLDALEESLRARGYATRVVELDRRPPEALRPVERLQERVASRAASRSRGGRVERVGADAGAAAAALGVDAIAFYHRTGDLPVPLPADAAPPYSAPGYRPRAVVVARPLGALSLVDASGNALTFGWGGSPDPVDGDLAPVNAAEAIEALLGALAAEPADPG